MMELPIEPPCNKVAEGYEWSPKDDEYWDMKIDEERDKEYEP